MSGKVPLSIRLRLASYLSSLPRFLALCFSSLGSIDFRLAWSIHNPNPQRMSAIASTPNVPIIENFLRPHLRKPMYFAQSISTVMIGDASSFLR